MSHSWKPRVALALLLSLILSSCGGGTLNSQRIAAERIGIARAIQEPLPDYPSECRQMWALLTQGDMVGAPQWSSIKRYESMLWVAENGVVRPGVINDRIRRCAAWYDRLKQGRG